MIIEIRKAGFINKGAELMLLSIQQKINERYPNSKIVLATTSENGSRPYSKLSVNGFYQKICIWRLGIQWGDFAKVIPSRLRQRYGMYLDSEVDIVLDASGFDYSDQWGSASSIEFAKSSSRWRKNGTKVILLPQAFGPFSDLKLQVATRQWASNVDLIFAREADSYEHLMNCIEANNREKLQIAPDFTNLIKGIVPDNYDSKDKKIALVPNYRMVDKTTKEDSNRYLPFMKFCASYLKDNNAKPFLLIHEGQKDLNLAQEIADEVGGLPIVVEDNPLNIKGIISTCDATISSRFHSLVSALSQGIPSIATGWSHKYEKLFEDYGFSEGIASVSDSNEALENKLQILVDDNKRSALSALLLKRSEVIKERSENMWTKVYQAIDS